MQSTIKNIAEQVANKDINNLMHKAARSDNYNKLCYLAN